MNHVCAHEMSTKPHIFFQKMHKLRYYVVTKSSQRPHQEEDLSLVVEMDEMFSQAADLLF